MSVAPASSSGSRRFRRSKLLLAAAVLGILLAGLIVWLQGVYVERENRYRHQAERELQSINQLQLQVILQWRQRSLRDANMLLEDDLLAMAAVQWLQHGDLQARTQVQARLRSMKELGQYAAAYLVDFFGRVRLSAGDDPGEQALDAVPATDSHILREAFASAQAVMADPVLDPAYAFPAASVLVPLYDGERSIGAVWLIQDLRTGLVPLVEPWPTPSRTAGSSIVWREGRAVRYLNAPRGNAADILQYSYPLDGKPTATLKALAGMRGVFYAENEAGSEVMAMATPVQGSSWLLVSTVEVAEVFADVRQRELLALALPVALLLLAAGGVFGIMLRRGWRRERGLKQDLERNLWWLESAQQAATMGHFSLDLQRREVRMSALCQRIHGLDSDTIPFDEWRELVLEEDRAEVDEVWARSVGGEEVPRMQCRIHPAGAPDTVRWVEIWNQYQIDDTGRGRVIGVVQDISERKAVEAELLEHRARLEAQLRTDPLTGVANRRALDEAAAVQMALALRGGTPLAVLMVDADHFKAYNDHYGHPAGDACLKALAGALCAYAGRAGELVARYGGEEFSVLLPGTDGEKALKLAQRMCRAVRELGIAHAFSPIADSVTISIGVACLQAGPDLAERARRDGAAAGANLVDQLFEAADEALYEAKRQGRNRAVLHAGGCLCVAAESGGDSPEGGAAAG